MLFYNVAIKAQSQHSLFLHNIFASTSTWSNSKIKSFGSGVSLTIHSNPKRILQFLYISFLISLSQHISGISKQGSRHGHKTVKGSFAKMGF